MINSICLAFYQGHFSICQHTSIICALYEKIKSPIIEMYYFDCIVKKITLVDWFQG